MADELAVLFLDTNILLQFKPLREIDWKAVADAKGVRLVLCSPVLDELDDKKNDPKTAERARSALAQLKQIEAAQGQVRDGVMLGTITDDEEANGNRDAAIIRRVLDYCERHDGQRVAVVSDDFNMRKRCQAKGVQCVDLDEQWRKPVEDENARRLRQLQQENQRLRNRLPDLRLLVSHGMEAKPVGLLELSLVQPALLDIEALLAETKRTHPKINARGLYYDTQEGDEYDSKLDKFYAEYREYLEHLAMHQNAQALTFELSLWIENRGTCPASDVRATLLLPDRFLLVIDKEDVDRYVNATVKRVDPNMELLFVGPRKPSAPRRPESRMERQLADFRASPGAIREDALWARPYIHQLPDLSAVMPKMDFQHSIEIEGTSIRLRAKKVAHNDLACIGTVLAVLNGWCSAVPFEASYEIQADEHPDGFAGKLAVRPNLQGTEYVEPQQGATS